jgi:hypothetical protein
MRYSLHLLNIEYTIIFDKPLFTLPQVQVEILRKAYDHFGEIYSIGLSDLQAGGGTTFSDVFVRIGIPGLRGLVEIRADRFSGTFRGMSYQTQIEEVKTGVQRLEEMLAEILPHLGRKTTSISATSWITCEGGAILFVTCFRGIKRQICALKISERRPSSSSCAGNYETTRKVGTRRLRWSHPYRKRQISISFA